jgi:periplasmic protein TonB
MNLSVHLQGGFIMSTHIQQASMFSGRSLVLMITIGLHALVISALMAIRMSPDSVSNVGPLKWVVLPDTVEPVPDVPLPDALIKVFVNHKVVAPDVPADPETRVQPDVTPGPQGPGITEWVPVPPDWGTAPGATRELQYQVIRPTDDYYPAVARRLEEQGLTVVRVCVDSAGRLDGMPRVEASSGNRRLDAAALAWAREALQFTPAQRDGVAVPACKGFRVNFTLR